MMTIQEISGYYLGLPGNRPALEAFIQEYLESDKHQQITTWATEHLDGMEYRGISVATNGTAKQRWRGGILGSKVDSNIIRRADKERPLELNVVVTSFMDLIHHHANNGSGSGRNTYNNWISKNFNGEYQWSGFGNWYLFFISMSVHPLGIGQKLIDIRNEVNGSEKVKDKYTSHMKKKFVEEFKPILQSLMKYGLSHDEIQELVNVELIKFIQGT